MGKIRVKTLGDEELEKEQKKETQKRHEAKKLSEATRLPKSGTDGQESASGEAEKTEEAVEAKVEVEEIETDTEPQKEVKKETKRKEVDEDQSFHSNAYQALSDMVDKSKTYSLSEALDLLTKLQRGKFDETVELHINTVSTGVSGNVTLPNGTGKKTRVVVASDALIAEIEKGVINFDILIAEPQMMAKLARVAKVLGPRGLMPNPKNGTITQNPQDLVKKYEGGQISFKTEAKSPIMHLTVGKMSFGKEKLTENIETMLKAVKKTNIVDITLKSTMSPGIKINA